MVLTSLVHETRLTITKFSNYMQFIQSKVLFNYIDNAFCELTYDRHEYSRVLELSFSEHGQNFVEDIGLFKFVDDFLYAGEGDCLYLNIGIFLMESSRQ